MSWPSRPPCPVPPWHLRHPGRHQPEHLRRRHRRPDLDLEVELSREHQLHWRQKGLILSGSLDDARQAKITSTQRGQVGNGGKANCSMERTDTVLVTLGQENATSLSGTI